MIAARVASKPIIDKLIALGYRHKRETVRVHMYRKGSHETPVTKSATMFETTARSILKQCGMTEAEVGEFIKSLGH